MRHEVAQLLDLVALAGAKNRIDQLRLDITDADRAAVSGLPEAPIVLHLGQRWFRRRQYPRKHPRARAATRRAARGGHHGRTRVRGSGRRLRGGRRSRGASAKGCRFSSGRRSSSGRACVVTVDTGATHVASAMRRPTLVAFEHRYFRLNSQEWAPYGVPHVLVRKPAYAGRSVPRAVPRRDRDRRQTFIACLIFPSSFRRTTGSTRWRT